MVNKIPFYGISSGGKVGLLSSRCHPATAQIMLVSCREILESCGVDSDDIYMIDCPDLSLIPGMSREIARSGVFAGLVCLAVLNENSGSAQAVRIGIASSDYEIPVVPSLVPADAGNAQIARAGEKAAHAVVELMNFASMLEELVSVGGFSADDDSEELEESDDEELEKQPVPKAKQARTKSTKVSAESATTVNRKPKK
jgi:6,7-dimethyl-8-ribityllumazine synthase